MYSDPPSPVLDTSGAISFLSSLSSSKYLAITVPLNTSVSVSSLPSEVFFPYSNLDSTLLVILSESIFLNFSDKSKLASTLVLFSSTLNTFSQVNVLSWAL